MKSIVIIQQVDSDILVVLELNVTEILLHIKPILNLHTVEYIKSHQQSSLEFYTFLMFRYVAVVVYFLFHTYRKLNIHDRYKDTHRGNTHYLSIQMSTII